MSRIILSMFMSIDGYVENPDGSMIRPEWSDDLEQHWSRPNVTPGSLLLYGRRALEQNAPLWPAMAADPKNSEGFRALARTMNELPKVVVSRTLERADWNATISRGPLAATVRELSSRFSGDIVAVGGVTLAAGLLAADLVDEYRLLVLPMLAGGGHSLFKESHGAFGLELRDVLRMDTGAVRLTYVRKRPGAADPP
jgi:dihydrofolate reductase